MMLLLMACLASVCDVPAKPRQQTVGINSVTSAAHIMRVKVNERGRADGRKI